ncbi:MAG: hypothetical protein ACJ788_09190, partial [Ktedonobacteraceae bacterium]
IAQAEDLTGRVAAGAIGAIMRQGGHAALAVGEREQVVGAVVAVGEAIAILVFIAGQVAVGAERELLPAAMEGQGRGAIAVFDQRGIEARGIGIGAGGTVIGEEGRVATGPMQGDPGSRIAQIQAHIMAKAEVPVIAQIAGETGLAIILADNSFINAGPYDMQVVHMRNQVAIGDIDLQFQVIVNGVGNVGIERQVA